MKPQGVSSFALGLIVNPLAGIGGPAALKGSDGERVVQQALLRGARPRAAQRCQQALAVLAPYRDRITVYCYRGDMGERVAAEAGFSTVCVGAAAGDNSCAEDTRSAARRLREQGVDLLLFVGGDGTARDVQQVIGDNFPALGVPAGVKMHSGVYAITPGAAGEIVLRMLQGRLVDIAKAEVRDIDEEAFRDGRVRARYYGELLVPQEGRFLQHVKSAGREVEELVLVDIAAELLESMQDDRLYLIGPGSTTLPIMQELGLNGTLLGVDAVYAGKLCAADVDEAQILSLLDRYGDRAHIVVTVIGGQGHIFGRGNQQLSAEVIRRVGLQQITVVASKTKISELEGRPLQVDTGDPQLDEQLSGYRSVMTGYRDYVLYPVGLAN